MAYTNRDSYSLNKYVDIHKLIYDLVLVAFKMVKGYMK